MKVLLVDDTRTLLSLIQVYLLGWGLQFVEARDGIEGLAKAREQKPDLIISDIRMPGMDGFEFCAAVRADRALQRVPFIMLTSLTDEISRRKGTLVGATSFLTKPIAPEQLRAIVAELLKLPPSR